MTFILFGGAVALAQLPPPEKKPPAPSSSYDQISPLLLGKEKLADVMAKDKADKPEVMARQQKLLEYRYDLTTRADPKLKMTRGKPIQVGPTARLIRGTTWDSLADMSPDEVRDQNLFPPGYLPLPHPSTKQAGCSFRKWRSSCSRDCSDSISISICRSISCRSFRRRSS